MVEGIEKFKEYFGAHNGKYAVIGGAACHAVFDQLGLPFRPSDDIDIVICVEEIDADFAAAFKNFLDDGGYRAYKKPDEDREKFYRFLSPSDPDFPAQIELFLRRAPGNDFLDDKTFIRIPVEDYIVSLSAILLDEAYYSALKEGKIIIDGISVIDYRLLIPFKALAFLNLTLKREEGEKISRDQIRKHSRDVFRLAQLIGLGVVYDAPEKMRTDVWRFIEAVKDDDTLDPRTFSPPVPFTREQGIERLRTFYNLG